jgi:hypothetical protein
MSRCRCVTGRGLLLVAVAAVLVSACAQIERFRADPRNACAGDRVTVQWSARWRPRLDAMPVLPGIGRVPGTGAEEFEVEETTHFVLTARGLFGDETAEADVEVAPRELGFGEVAQCVEADGVLRSEFAIVRQVSSAFLVDTVANVLPRPLAVEKGEREVRLEANGESDGLRGQPATGTWVLTSPLDPGETCETALGSVRQRLRLRIRLACGG